MTKRKLDRMKKEVEANRKLKDGDSMKWPVPTWKQLDDYCQFLYGNVLLDEDMEVYMIRDVVEKFQNVIRAYGLCYDIPE